MFFNIPSQIQMPHHLCSMPYVSVCPQSVEHIHMCRIRCSHMDVFSCGRILMCACLCLSVCFHIKILLQKFLCSRGSDLQSSSSPVPGSEQF